MKYITTVNDKEYIIEIDQENRILVNGEAYDVNINELRDLGMVSLLLNNRSYEAVVEEQDDVWETLVAGELYSVQVQDERAYRLAQARGQGGAGGGGSEIKSPMPGIIIAVPVEEGQTVKKGDKVIILESMKMENELKAPRDGVIARVAVSAGDSVEKNQVLIAIGDPEE